MFRFTYTWGAISDKGDIRAENQDSILFLTENTNEEPSAIFIVADGMGGLSFGSQVSHYITEQFQRWWYRDFPDMLKAGMKSAEDIRELMEQEIWDINKAVFDFKNRMQCKSGSTLSLLLLYQKRYYIENIGDSRIYLMRGSKMRQLTQDHSAEVQIKKNTLKATEKQYLSAKNKLTMCIGMFQIPQSNFYTGEIYKEDCFLVCSDGFYHPLEEHQLETVIKKKEMSAQEKVENLRKMIEKGKATDNISAIIAEVH